MTAMKSVLVAVFLIAAQCLAGTTYGATTSQGVQMTAATARSVQSAVFPIVAEYVVNGTTSLVGGTAFAVGPSALLTALHTVANYGQLPTALWVKVGGVWIGVNSVQPYVDPATFDRWMVQNGGESGAAAGQDIAILSLDHAALLQTGWFQISSLVDGPAEVVAYAGTNSIYNVLTGGVLQQDGIHQNTSAITGMNNVLQEGDSGGLVMQSGDAVGILVGGNATGTIGTVANLSSLTIPWVQQNIASDNAKPAIAAQISGELYYDAATKLAPGWRTTELSQLESQLAGPNGIVASTALKNIVNSAIQGAAPEIATNPAVAATIVRVFCEQVLKFEPTPQNIADWTPQLMHDPIGTFDAAVESQMHLAIVGSIPFVPQ